MYIYIPGMGLRTRKALKETPQTPERRTKRAQKGAKRDGGNAPDSHKAPPNIQKASTQKTQTKDNI